MSEVAVVAAPAPDPERVAAAQRLLIFSMVAVCISVAIDLSLAKTVATRYASLGLEVISILVSIYGVVRMGQAMRSPAWLTVLCCLSMVIGILNLIVLAWLNARAIPVLRAAGWKVGFFGARRPAG